MPRKARALGIVFRATLAEILAGFRVPLGWVLLAAMSLLVAVWVSRAGGGGRIAMFAFSGNFSLLCVGDVPRGEYRSGRATALLQGGVPRGVHYLGVCLAWTAVLLGGDALFTVMIRSWEIFTGEPSLSLAGCVGISLGFLPLVAIGWLLGLLLPSWSNVAAVVCLGLGLRMVEGYPETFGPLSTLAALLVGSSRTGSCTAAGIGTVSLVAESALRWGAFLAAGVLLAQSSFVGRTLGKACLRGDVRG